MTNFNEHENAHYGKIEVLDKGYVILRDRMGDDLTPVNAARVSYDKRSDALTERDMRLLRYLANHGHTSPFRHAIMQFEIYAPLLVARQWWKYIVGSAHQEATGDSLDAWNESSRRYITEEPEFYLPDAFKWRTAPQSSKQGSGEPVPEERGAILHDNLYDYIEYGLELYESALSGGIAPEQARLFLPAYGLYVRWFWTASLQSVAHFLVQRLADDAQSEITDYAKAILELARAQFPASLDAMIDQPKGESP